MATSHILFPLKGIETLEMSVILIGLPMKKFIVY